MTKIIRFYNRYGKWYADLPQYIEEGGTEEECEMILGADTWLDELANDRDGIHIEISTDEPLGEELVLYSKDDSGGTYLAHEYKGEVINHVLWLCNVTLWLLGEFPQVIYYKLKN